MTRTWLNVLIALLWTAGALAQAPSAADASQQESAQVVEAKAPLSLQTLKGIESRVRSLLERVSPATVSVQIGGANGSGVVVSPDGYVLTAAHVSGRPHRTATITFPDGRSVRATSLGSNNFGGSDAGLLKIEDEGRWPTVEMAHAGDATLGDWCFALGYPGGYDKDRGPVLRVGRIINVQKHVMWTDCTLLGGDSGGPLFDLHGRVIGIHSRISRPTAANFHAPIDVFHEQWEAMVAGEVYIGPLLPYFGTDSSDDEKGARIELVRPNTAAAQGGVQPGDVVTRFAEHHVNSAEHLTTLILAHKPGDKIKVIVLRENKEVELEIELGKRPGR